MLNYVFRKSCYQIMWKNMVEPNRPWGPPSLLYNVYRVFFAGVKRPGRGVELCLCSPSEHSWPLKSVVFNLGYAYRRGYAKTS